MSDNIEAGVYIRKIYGNLSRNAIALAGIRYREGITQMQLAKILGMSQSQISKMENGRKEIDQKTFEKIKNFIEENNDDQHLPK